MRIGSEIQVAHLFADSVPSLVPVCWIRILAHLRSRRFHLRVILSRKSHLPESALNLAEEKGIEITEIPALADAEDRIYSFRLRFHLRGLFRKWGTDLIHTHYMAAVGPTVQCLKGVPNVTAVHSLYLDTESLGSGWFHRTWARRKLERRLAAARRVIVQDKNEEALIRAFHIAKRYQLERIPFAVDVEAIRNLEPQAGVPGDFQGSRPEYRVGLFIPDIAKGPFKRTLFSLRSLFDSSKEVTVWCVVPGGQVREIRKMCRRLRFPEQFHLVGGVLPWEWIGSRVRVAWIPGLDTDSDVAAAISSAFGIPVLRFTSLETHRSVSTEKNQRPSVGIEILREILSDPSNRGIVAPEQIERNDVDETADLLCRCYNDVLRESGG